MDRLTDTNLLVARVQRAHPRYQEARNALQRLRARGDRLCVFPQNIVEFWAVATRPLANNGLGLTPTQADRLLERVESGFLLLRDTADLHDRWRQLVVKHGVSGKATYDARLVAAMEAHGLTSILTFNGPDFRRYLGIQVVHPREV